jgi:hypothetical protein
VAGLARFVAPLLATAALWVRIQTILSKIQNGRHKQGSAYSQHTLARQKNIQKSNLFNPYSKDLLFPVFL